MGGLGGFGGRRGGGDHAPVELRFIDLLLIIIAILMFMAVLLSLVSANAPSGEAKESPVRRVTVTTAKAPDVLADEPYALTLAAEGGQGPYRWTRVDGTLPGRLTLSEDGTVSGRAELEDTKGSATTTATVRVQDSAGRSAERTLKWSVRRAQDKGAAKPVLRVTARTLSVPDGRRGKTYEPHRFTAQAGSAPYTWQVGDGLPDGMKLSGRGELSGKPAEAGSYSFEVRVTDGTGAEALQRVRMLVGDTPARAEEAEKDRWELPKWLVVAGALLALVGALIVAFVLKFILFGAPPGMYEGRRGWLT